MSQQLDGRRENVLAQELLRRAEVVLGQGSEPIDPGRIETAILTVAARISEEVTRRLDKVPAKQADNFYSAVGIGRDPARPARVPVAFQLSDTAATDVVAQAGTKLLAPTTPSPTIFETERAIELARGVIAKVVAVDLQEDEIFIAAPTVPQAQLPAAKAIRRILTAGAGAGATVLQVSPAVGLAPDTLISIETVAGAGEYSLLKIDGELVTIMPPLDADAIEGATVSDVVQFAPFESGARDRQSHILYISHPTLLDVPSAADITVSGLEITQVPNWEWFGKVEDDDGEAAWIPFESADFEAGQWRLAKPKGKPEKTAVEGRSGLWIRARLPKNSLRVDRGQTIRIAVNLRGACGLQHEERCDEAEAGVEYEAIAVTTPVVTTKPFYPFGREPRLFDSFYIGSKEAFGKAAAEISLCFELGGLVLGQMAAVSDGTTTEVYAVGTDGLLWRATITDDGASFSQVPGPIDANGRGFLSQAMVVASLKDGKVRLAIGDDGAVHAAKFDYGSQLPDGAVEWTRLAIEGDEAAARVSAVFQAADAIYALAGKSIFTWTGASASADITENAVDLLPVQGADEALLVTERVTAAGSKWQIQSTRAGAQPIEVSPSDYAHNSRAAWASPSGRLFIAGFEEVGDALVVTEVASAPTKVAVGNAKPQPIAFDLLSNVEENWPPAIVTANPNPVAFVPSGPKSYRRAPMPEIGLTANDKRQHLTKDKWTLIQHEDQGLRYRESDNKRILAEKSFRGFSTAVVREPDVPANAAFLTFEEKPKGDVFYLAANSDGDRLIVPLSNAAEIGDEAEVHFFEVRNNNPEQASVAGNVITITNVSPSSDIVILLIDGSTMPPGLAAWHLTFDGTDLKKPTGFPGGSSFLCVVLDELTAPVPEFEPFFWLADESLPGELNSGPLSSFYDDNVELTAESVERFDLAQLATVPAIPLAEDLADGNVARFAIAANDWQSLGPNQPANPALSWEYWNGSSWWSLDPSDLYDRTAHLQLSDGVFFTVPEDLQETEVGGRTNRWIRARLVGGDYGEARVIVKTEKVSATVDEQTVTRDLGAIRAPYVIGLTVGYCATTAISPEIILTADNLSIIDQTSANNADLAFNIFPPVSVPMTSVPSPVDEEGADECCERWPEPLPATREPPEPPVPQFRRALLIGLEQQPARGRLSLYVNIAPGPSASGNLTAAAYRGGEFQAATISGDATVGFTERGVIELQIDDPPDLVQLFGTTAYWLRIVEEGDSDKWLPRIRGVYLNGVLATSVETRSFESLGTSTGAPDQSFLLPASPIVPESLSLVVAEPIGAEEAEARGAQSDIAGMPGPWIPWQRAEKFPESSQGEPDRLFTLDAQAGKISFGDGRNALVPPIGSAILAVAYKRVAGLAANGVEAGAQLQTVGPLAGVDQVLALENAAGGVDVEAPDAARMRASAKMRHQGRIVSLADIEDFVLARLPSIAQVRASNRQGAVQLVVVASGTDPIPLPSALRAIEDAVGKEATYGIRAAGRLRAVAPRILGVNVELMFDSDPGIDWVALQEEAEAAILKLLNHETGGFEGRGWPVGYLPTKADISAAVERLTDRGNVLGIGLVRADGKPVPDPMPRDVLVRIETLNVQQAERAAA